MSINFIGSFSGIDNNTIEQLMSIEKRPLIQFSEQKISLESRKNAWNDVKTRLNSLMNKIRDLQKEELYTSKTATSGHNARLEPSKNTEEGEYVIKVHQLASKASIIGGTISNAEESLGNVGVMLLNESTSIEVESTDSLYDVSKKINDTSKESSITSSVIDGRLVLTNQKTGKIDISVTDKEGAVASYLGLIGGQRIEGKNALFSVNNVEIERQSNEISGVIEGTKIFLEKESKEGVGESFSIRLDKGKLKATMMDFVSQYNSMMSFLEDATNPGTPGEKTTRGTLSGDSAIQRLKSALRTYVSSTYQSESKITDISNLGISTTGKSSQLSFSESKLEEYSLEDIQSFFSGKEGTVLSKMDELIDNFISPTGIVKNKSSNFDRSLTELNKQVDRFNLRMEKKEAYYANMFANLDEAMMKAESQISWLTAQLSTAKRN